MARPTIDQLKQRRLSAMTTKERADFDQTYDATRLMLMALDKSGPDRKKLRDAIEQITDFKAATTAPAQPFTADDHEAIEIKDIFVGQLKEVDGKLQVVKAQ